ncbi:MAG: PAS domain S-box protein, partial [Methanoregula sp.]
ALSDSEKRLADIIDFLPDATFAIDTSGKIIAWNRVMEEMTGVAAAQVLGRGNHEYALAFYGERRPMLIDLIFSPDSTFEKNHYTYIRHTTTTITAETVLGKVGQPAVSLWGTASGLFNDKGVLVGAIESIRDITELKKSEQELQAANEQLTASEEELRTQYTELAEGERRIRESEEKYRTLVEHSKDGIFIAQDGRLVFHNRGFRELLGYAEGEPDGAPLDRFIAPEDRELVLSRHYSRLAGEQLPEVYECKFLCRDGSTRKYVTINVGKATYLGKPATIGTIRDITDERLREEQLRESEEKYRTLVENLQDVVYRTDRNGRLIMVSPSGPALLGYDFPEDLLGKSIADSIYLVPEKRQEFLDAIYRDGSVKDFEIELRRMDGSPVIVSTSSHLYYDRNGAVLGIEGVLHDITGLKDKETELKKTYEQIAATEEELWQQYAELERSEKQIRESEVRHRYLLGLFENAQKSEQELFMAAIEGAGVMTGSPLGYLALVSDDESELLMYGWSQSAMAECGMQEKPLVYKTETTGLWGEAVRQRRAVITNDYAAPNPWKKGYPPGHPQILRHMNVPLMDGDHIVLVVGVANKPEEYTDHDVEELSLLMQGLWQVIKQKRAQAALQEEMTFSDAVLDSVPGLLYLYDENERLVRWNRNHELSTGYSHDELAGWQLMDWFKGDEKSSMLVSAGVKKAYEEGVADTEAELTTKDGTKVPYYFTAVRLDIGGRIYFTGVGIDISARRKAEKEILRRQEQMEEITATVPGVVYLAHIKPDGSIEFPYVNVHAGEKIFGYDHTTTDFLGWFSSHVHADDRQKFLDSVAAAVSTGSRDWYFEGRFIRPDGTLMWFQATATAGVHNSELMYYGVLLDITPRKQAENAIREANRKLNLLTSITRHDMANQLTVVRGYAQMASLKKPDPAVGDFIAKIDRAVSAIQGQVEFMRTYQDLGVKTPSWFRIERLVHSARPASGPSVTCTCGTTEIFADPMINKVFSNLFDNAVRHGETVTDIQVSCEKAADTLIITVEDNGEGIPLDEKQKIFEKGFGRNTGFGLFLVREILAITGISIHETGRHGKGARFEITVPGGGYRSFSG